MVGLFTGPARLHRPGQGLERGVCGEVGEVVFALAVGAVFTDQPAVRIVLPDAEAITLATSIALELTFLFGVDRLEIDTK